MRMNAVKAEALTLQFYHEIHKLQGMSQMYKL